MLKNRWQRTGHHQSMVFSSLVLQLRLLMGITAMNLSVWHHIARGKGPGHEWYSDVSKVLETKNELTINEVCKSLPKANLQDGTITTLFERKGKGNVSFSMKQHTYMETQSVNIYNLNKSRKILTTLCRVECVKWVAESMRSMKIVDDPGFHQLMKMAVLNTEFHPVEQ